MEFDDLRGRIGANKIQVLLDLFDEQNISATFFVLGWVAERCPQLVKEIDHRGHEVASHGFSHRLVYTQTRDEFKEETLKAKTILEEIIGKPVYGYRAASYSITSDSMWALDILAEAEFAYDSSIFPVRHDRYGIPGAERTPSRLVTPSGHSLFEFPLSTWKLLGTTVPIAGGGYFRLFPYTFTKRGLRSVNLSDHSPFVFYLHPWEIDTEQPRVQASRLSRFRHYNNLDRMLPRLKRLLGDFQFGTMHSVISTLDLQ